MTAYQGYIRLMAIRAESVGITQTMKAQGISCVGRFLLQKRLNKLDKEYNLIINKFQQTTLSE